MRKKRTLSEEHRRKISIALKGRSKSLEHRRKISEGKRKVKMTNEEFLYLKSEQINGNECITDTVANVSLDLLLELEKRKEDDDINLLYLEMENDDFEELNFDHT